MNSRLADYESATLPTELLRLLRPIRALGPVCARACGGCRRQKRDVLVMEVGKGSQAGCGAAAGAMWRAGLEPTSTAMSARGRQASVAGAQPCDLPSRSPLPDGSHSAPVRCVSRVPPVFLSTGFLQSTFLARQPGGARAAAPTPLAAGLCLSASCPRSVPSMSKDCCATIRRLLYYFLENIFMRIS